MLGMLHLDSLRGIIEEMSRPESNEEAWSLEEKAAVEMKISALGTPHAGRPNSYGEGTINQSMCNRKEKENSGDVHI